MSDEFWVLILTISTVIGLVVLFWCALYLLGQALAVILLPWQKMIEQEHMAMQATLNRIESLMTNETPET